MFKKSLHEARRVLEIGCQQDSDSCGICVVNSIEHYLFGATLFTHTKRSSFRIYYFTKAMEFLLNGVRTKSFVQIHNAHSYRAAQVNTSSTSERPQRAIVGTSQDIHVGPDNDGEAEQWSGVETGADGVDVSGSEADAKGSPQNLTASDSHNDTASVPPSSSQGQGPHPSDPVLERKRHIHSDLDTENEIFCGTKKRQKIGGVGVGTDDEGSCEERGESRSAVASRKLNESLKSGGFNANKQKRRSFEEKCERMGGGARFRYGEKWEVLHLKCGKWLTMNEPYNTTCHKLSRLLKQSED